MKFKQIEDKVKEHDKILDRIKSCNQIISRCRKPYRENDNLYFCSGTFEDYFGKETWERVRNKIKPIMVAELEYWKKESAKLQKEISDE